MNLNPLSPIADLLQQNLREQVAIRKGIQLLLAQHGVISDLGAEADAELSLLSEEVANVRPGTPDDIIQTDQSRFAVDEALSELGDDTEQMLMELEKEAPELARQLRVFITDRNRN